MSFRLLHVTSVHPRTSYVIDSGLPGDFGLYSLKSCTCQHYVYSSLLSTSLLPTSSIGKASFSHYSSFSSEVQGDRRLPFRPQYRGSIVFNPCNGRSDKNHSFLQV